MAKIKIKNSLTAGSTPSGLSLGEMAVNIADKKIFIGNAVEGVVTLHDQNNLINSISGYTGIIDIVGGRGITYGFSTSGKTLYHDINYSTPGITGLTFQTTTSASTSDKVLLQRKPSDRMELITVGNLLATAYAVAPTNISGSISGYRFAFFDASGNQYSSTSTNVQDEILNPTVRSLNGQTGHIQLSYVSSFNGQTGDVYGVSSINGATGAITNVAKTDVAQTFTQLQDFSAGISASIIETSNNGCVVTDQIWGKSNNDILITGVSDTFSGFYTDGTQDLEATRIWAGGSWNVDSPGASSRLHLTSNNNNNKVEAVLKIVNYDGINDIGVTAASIVLSNPYAQETLNGKIELYSTDTTTIESANGLSVLSGATFTRNIYAPNIVNSVNGVTGPVGITFGKNISLTQSGQTLTIGISAARPGDTGAIQFNDGSGGLSASILFNYTTSSGTLRVGGASRYLTLYNTSLYNVVQNNGTAYLCLSAPNSGAYLGDPLNGASGTYVGVDSTPSHEVAIKAKTTKFLENAAQIYGYNSTGNLKIAGFGTSNVIGGDPHILIQDADTDFNEIPFISIYPSIGSQASLNLGYTALTDTYIRGSSLTVIPRSSHSGGITTANLYVSGGTTFIGNINAPNIVTSVNGATGDITNVAKLNTIQTFTAINDFERGISASNSTGSNVLDVIATTDGCGLRIAQAASGSSARVGGIRLGRSTSNNTNSYIENYVGQLKFFNGISGTNGTPGTNMLQLSTSGAIFGVPIFGPTFGKSVYAGNDSAYISILSTDASLNPYSSNILANSFPTQNTTHTLPATSGTLLNSTTPYVSSINGLTGAVTNINAATVTATSTNVNATRYLTFVGGAGDTGIFIDPTTTPLTYNPSGGNIGAKKVTLTTGSNVVTVDSAGVNVVLTDGTNISTFGLDSFAANYIAPFTISNPTGLTLSSNTPIEFNGTGYSYVFPGSNGSNGQVLTTNGAGTLSWTTVSGGGGGSATGFTYASSAPVSPSVGDRWIDSDTGKEYVYVNDGSSSQWIEPVSSNGLSGVTYTSATNFIEFGVTGSFVKLGVNNTSPQYTLDVNGVIHTPVGISAGPITSSGATFSGAVTSDGGYRITSSAINAQTGTSYTLLTSDNGKIITMSNGSAITLTVPSGLPIGFNTTIIQLGTGQVGITASSTTLNSFEGKLNLAGQHAAASIISYTTNVFNVAGGLTA
jgi:hypothetical protein